MKHIFKKVSSLCTVLVMMAVLTLTGASAVWAEEVDDTVKQTLISTAEGLTDTIVALSDEDVENYSKSSDAFTVGAMTAWAGSKAELGALKERTGETEVKASDDGYTVTVPASFEKADANFVYIFDGSTGAPTSLTVDVTVLHGRNLKKSCYEYHHGYCNCIHRSYFPELPYLSVQIHSEPGSKEKSSGSSSCTCSGGSTSGSCRNQQMIQN